ncbi:hypothetical protein IGI39_004827 [Enterococcus sp. AZ135]|uniref:universal stress protein n=1 Tax=unclassified Enterococcus TaxID=2608891 RepID=UPI003F25E3CD
MTEKYKNILVALDGSDQAFEALEKAISIAERNSAKLFLVTAINFSPWATNTQTLELLLDDNRSSAKRTMAKAKKQVPADIEFHFELMNGNPKACIIQYSEENNIDLIVMGATGAGAFSRLLLGSTTAYVVNHAPCNVLVVR